MITSDFSTLFEFLPIGAYRSSPEGKQLRANVALVLLNGYESEAEMLSAVNDIGREWYVDPDQRTRFAQLLNRDGHVVDFVSEIYRHKTRDRIWIRETAHVVRDTNGQVLFFEGTVEDITSQRLTRIALETSERRFRALTEKAQVLTVVCDAWGDVSYVSPASRRILGSDPLILQGSNVFSWIHPEDQCAARAELARVVAFQNSGVESIDRFAHSDGSWRYLACVANNCLFESAVSGIVLNFRDVTERKNAEAALQRLADYDALTDLPNRRYLIGRVAHAMVVSLTRSRRLNALLFLDLDHFKSVNDCHGHKMGDLLLQAVSKRLRESTRAVDTVARYGGDEFVILLEDLDAIGGDASSQALAVGAKILVSLSQPYNLDGLILKGSCSLGATVFGDKREEIDEIFKRADAALYAAKDAGRNTLRLQ